EIVASHDVFLTHMPALRSQKMSARYIGDADQVEASVERREHASQKIVEDQLAGGCGPDLPRADGIARVDDDDRQAARDVLLSEGVGEGLRALLGADRIGDAG